MQDREFDRSIQGSAGEGCWRGSFTAMASDCEVLCETRDADDARRLTKIAADEAWRIEDKFSRYQPGNIIDRINRASGKSVAVDEETAQLIDFAVTLYEISDCRFDITSGVLRRVWRFDGSEDLPTAEQIAAIVGDVGWHRVSWTSQVLQMPAAMEIDLGGIGKEYAVDRAAEKLRHSTDVSCLVNFGGDLAVTSAPQHLDCWHVGIESHNAPLTMPTNVLSLRIGALATSGDARRSIFKDGVRYSHILNPRTGWPVPNAPHSVTVAADSCTQAGMLCTLAMLRGEGAETFLDAQSVKYWCKR